MKIIIISIALTENGWNEERNDENNENVDIIYNSNKSLSIEQQRIRLPVYNVFNYLLIYYFNT